MAFTVTSTPKVKASTPKGAPLVKGPATGRLAALLEQERDLLGVGPVTEDVYESLDTAYKEAHPKAVVEDTVQGTFTSADNVAVDKRVAADIYNDQQWTPYILGQHREEAYVDPELDQEQEKADLEEFAYRINVSPEDVAQDPALYEQFGRHLGKKYRVLNKDKYFEYNDEGGQPPNAQRIPTPWVQPRHVSKNTVHDVEGFMFEKQNPTTEEEFAYNAGLRVYDALQNTLNKVAYGPSVQSKIHAKAVEESGNTAEDMAHFVNKFVASYASLAEHDIDVGKAWSDIMLHSVLAYYKGNHWRSVLRNKDIETGKELDAESEFRGGVAGDQEIGHMVLSSMGVEKSTNKEKALAGSLSRNIVTDVFSKNVGNNMWEEKLFEISALDTDGYKNPRVEALTQHGIQISLRVQDLTSEIVPSSIRDVRTNTITPTLKDAIPRKTRGTKNIEYGNLQQQLENLHIQSNTMFSIHTPTVNVLNAIMGNIRAIPLLDGPAYLGIKGDGSAFEDAKGTMGQRKGFHYKRNYKGQLLNKNDEVVNDYNLAERVSDVSDLIKDKAFNNELQWAIEKSKLDGFYYDYFYGLNNRLHVDQTIGNYQHSKLARAFLGAAKTKYTGKIYNVGTGKPQTVNYLSKLVGGKKVFIPNRPGEPKCSSANISKIESELFNDPHGRPTQPIKVIADEGPWVIETTFAADYIASNHWHAHNTLYFIMEGEMEFGPDEPLYEKGDIRVVKGGYSYGPEKPGENGVKFILISNGGPVDLNWSDITPPPR